MQVLDRAVYTEAPVAYLDIMNTNRCQADEFAMRSSTRMAGDPTAESAL